HTILVPSISTSLPYTTLFRSGSCLRALTRPPAPAQPAPPESGHLARHLPGPHAGSGSGRQRVGAHGHGEHAAAGPVPLSRSRLRDRKSTRLNSSHQIISYAVF